MRDLAQFVSGEFRYQIGIGEARVTQRLAAHHVTGTTGLWIAESGTWWKVNQAHTVGGTKIITIDSAMFGSSTSRPDGLYHIPPPFQWPTLTGAWLDRFDAAQPFSWQPI